MNSTAWKLYAPRAKFYHLSKAGTKRLERETSRWTQMVEAVTNVLTALPAEA